MHAINLFNLQVFTEDTVSIPLPIKSLGAQATKAMQCIELQRLCHITQPQHSVCVHVCEFFLCRIFAALVAYVVVGAFIMYTLKGACGTEIIPNIGFCNDLPFLIKVHTEQNAIVLVEQL